MDIDQLLEDTTLSLKEKAARLQKRIDAEKALMDTETRRKCRSFWIFISIAAFFIGVLVGHFVW